MANSSEQSLQNIIDGLKNYINDLSEMEDSRQKLATTLQSIGDGVIATDLEGKITRMNPVAEKLTGWEFTKAKGRQLRDIFKIKSAKTGEPVKNPVSKVLENGKIVGMANDTTLIARDGTERQISDSAAPIRDFNDNIKGVVLVFSDVSEEYELRKKLKDTKEELETFFDLTPDLLCIADIEGNFIKVNKAWEKKLGYKAEKLENSKILDFVHPDDLDKTKEAMNDLADQKKVLNFVNRFQDKNNNSHYIEWRSYLRGEYIYAAARDTTRRIKAEQNLKTKNNELRAQRDFNNTILNTLKSLVVVINTRGEIVRFNNAAEKVTGYSEKEVRGKKVWDIFIIENELEQVKNVFSDLASENFPNENENYWITKNGKKRLISWSNSAILDKNDEVKYVVGTGIDVTEQREQEDQIIYISYHDSLTDLYNRTYLEEEIERLDVPRQMPLSLIMVDLNGLKLINDSYGHKKGDKLLQKTAQILEDSCREEEIVGRWGGDEFIIVLPETTQKNAQKISKRIKKKARKVEGDIPISIAAGTGTKEKASEDIYKVLQKAENNMYDDKMTNSHSVKSNIVKTLLNTLGEKSDETEAHARRMEKLAILLGERLGLLQSQLSRLSLLAKLHDIGKTVIPEEILTKPEKLTEEEWEIIKEHPETGYRIASSTSEFAHISEEILTHHERWDGEGYPRGMSGEEIPLLARIIAIVDAYDVMTNGRPYKEAISKEKALKELKTEAGKQFDPKLVKEFLNIV
ncbi:MAG: PAS domain S-box protein [Halanaerobiales bacterium]